MSSRPGRSAYDDFPATCGGSEANLPLSTPEMGSFYISTFPFILIASSLSPAFLLRPLDGSLSFLTRVHPEVYLRQLRQGYELGSSVSQRMRRLSSLCSLPSSTPACPYSGGCHNKDMGTLFSELARIGNPVPKFMSLDGMQPFGLISRCRSTRRIFTNKYRCVRKLMRRVA